MVDIKETGSSLSELINLPKCFIAWIGSSESEPYQAGTTVNTPIYHTLDREKLLC